MAQLEKCPYCDISTRPQPLFGGVCKWHLTHAGSLVEIPSDMTIVAVKLEKTVNSVSEKMKVDLRKYGKLRKLFLTENLYCIAKLEGCTRLASDIHHAAGRIGKNLLDQSKWKPLCRNCHFWVTENSDEAIRRGFSEKRLD